MRTYNQQNSMDFCTATAGASFINHKTLDVAVKSVVQHLNTVNITDTSVVSGTSIGDIPSSYTIPTVGRHERPVVGTFVHQDVVPGFRYRVRCNGTDDFHFDGKPLLLESIGQGYGKRLTFESEDILRNNNYFWSDSRPLGYAFSIHVLDAGMKFDVREEGLCVGSCEVQQVAEEQELLSSRNDMELMQHIKEVKVNFWCNFSVPGEQDFRCYATSHVTLVKGRRMERGEIKHVDVVLDDLKRQFRLVPVLEEC